MIPFQDEFTQPLVRETNLRTPVVEGFSTGRLRTASVLLAGTAEGNRALTLVTASNRGPAAIGFQLQQGDTKSGSFTAIGPETDLVVGGEATFSIYPEKRYLEVKGTDGTGYVDFKLTGQVRFEQVPYGRDEVQFPSRLWDANYPGWDTL